MGKDDKCYELETLRSFRDSKLLKDEHLQKLVYEYYDISPKFVDTIEQHPEKGKFSQYLLDNHIQKIISCIEKGDDDKAIELYKNMLQNIEKNN
ncbi:MAG TPA: hypothetical protein ENK66_10800 [Arcobacter sp.]|nr:hypothetical protein [Arcobacter sp.]